MYSNQILSFFIFLEKLLWVLKSICKTKKIIFFVKRHIEKSNTYVYKNIGKSVGLFYIESLFFLLQKLFIPVKLILWLLSSGHALRSGRL